MSSPSANPAAASIVNLAPGDGDVLLDGIEHAAFGYFLQTVNPANGLVADTSRDHSPSSIAVVGFALSVLSGGGRARLDDARRCASSAALAALRFFRDSDQSGSAGGDRLQGLLLPLPRHAHRSPRLALGAVDDRHRAADRRRADRAHVLHRGHRTAKPSCASSSMRCTGASTGAGRRTAAGRSGKAGSRSADSCTTAGRATARRSCSTCSRWARRRIRSTGTATRRGPRPTSGRTCTATIFSMRGRCSSISSRMHGSIFAASRIASCARSAATISRTAGARPTCSASTRGATRTDSPATTKTAGALPPAMARATSCAALTGEHAALLRLCRARRAVRAGRRNARGVGGARVAAVRARDRAVRRAQHASALSARCCAISGTRAASIRPSIERGRTRLGVGRPLRARPGHRRDDDRELSHAS